MNIDFLYSEFLEIKKISTDTRKPVKGSIFFCLKGKNFNGNEFALQAFKQGAKMIVTEETKYNNPEFFIVKDVLKCLQKLAEKHRANLNIPIIAITGTNGKTSTKNLISSILKTKLHVSSTLGNLNNHIGLPLTILSIEKHHEIAVLEFGASKLGDIKELCEIAKPTHGIITNIGKAHLEEFKNISNIIKTKTELWSYLIKNKGTIFLNNEESILKDTFIKSATYSQYKKVIYFGKEIDNILLVTSFPFLTFKFNNLLVKTKIVGEYNLINIISAMKIGSYFGINQSIITTHLKNNSFNNNRSQLIKTKNNQIILDAYNANPSSMLTAIKNFLKINVSVKKTLIIGDMLELGKESRLLHQEIVDFLNITKIEKCILVGDLFFKTNSKFQKFKSKKSLEEFLIRNTIKNNLILIKGSRNMALETLKTSL